MASVTSPGDGLSAVRVTHALGAYPVYVEPGSIERLGPLVEEHLAGRRVAMIADEAVLALYRGGRFGKVSWEGETLPFPTGERSKTRDTWARLTDALLQRGFGRDSGIIALGGGVAGDLAGFVAATYMRGLPYIQVPTTLLAMLDASVGGKTGVDTPEGKNLIGAFHPPVAVVADPGALATLAEREFRGGLAEAVKHGLIADREYFRWIEREADALLRRDAAALEQLVRRSVEIKAEVVSADEREAGRRAILNAGHTVGARDRTGDRLRGAPRRSGRARPGRRMRARRPAGPGRARAPGAGGGSPRPVGPSRPASPAHSARRPPCRAWPVTRRTEAPALRFSLPTALGVTSEGRWTVEAREEDVREAVGALS